MVIVIGKVRVQAAKLAEALRVSHEHVERSRKEQGCLEHGVHQSAEDPTMLVFVERWASAEDLRAHFGLRESNLTVRALSGLAIEPPSISVFESQPISLDPKSVA